MIAPLLASVVGTLKSVAEPWKNLYDDSKVVATIVVFVHLGALLVGGGIALATDRATLRAVRGTPDVLERQLAELGITHRIVISALVVSFLSGVALFLADVETFVSSIAFYIKISLVALLLINGLAMTRFGRSLRRGPRAREVSAWGPLRATAVASVVLWLATLLAGVALTNAS